MAEWTRHSPLCKPGCAIVSSHLEPTGIRVRASIQPAITPLTGNSAGSPRATDCVEHGTVDQLTGVVYANVVGTRRDCAITLIDFGNCKPDSVLFTPSRSRFSSRYFTPSAAISSKRATYWRQHVRGFHAAHGVQRQPAQRAACLPARQRYPTSASLVTDLRARFAQLLSLPANRCRSLPALR